MSKETLISNRLQFRLVEAADIDSIHALLSLPETDKYNALGTPADSSATQAIIAPWILGNQQAEISKYTFAIELKPSGKFIGLIGLNLKDKKYSGGEIWYKLRTGHWGNGYATEALNRILDFCFDTLKLHRIQAGVAVENIASIKVMEKVGMTREGIGRKILPLKSGWADNYAYSILDTDIRPINSQ